MRKRICFCTTISGTIKSFLIDFANYLVENENYDVSFICNSDDSLFDYTNEHIHYFPIKMKRGLSFDGPWVIWQFYKIFKREKFDIVQYSTRNASTYGSIAARMAGIKVRLYCQWGLMFIALKGFMYHLMKFDEWLVAHNATHIETESFSIYERSIEEGIYKKEKSEVIWNGSACGVNLDKYDMSQKSKWRKEYREKYNIPQNAIVFGYCGRITRDKGLNELFAAFREIIETQKREAYLMIIGRNDRAETIDSKLFSWAKQCHKVIFTGFTKEVCQHYSALDVFCSLSYREGFGLVVIEAAAMGVPGIVTDCPGQRDTIEDQVTGISVPDHNVDKVVIAMNKCIDNPNWVEQLGNNARTAVENKYEQKELFRRLAAHRNEIFNVTYH